MDLWRYVIWKMKKKMIIVKIDENETCYLGDSINIQFEYLTEEETNAHVHVYTKSGYNSSFKIKS